MSESESTAKFNAQITAFGINPSKISRNLSVEKLVEISVEKNEGMEPQLVRYQSKRANTQEDHQMIDSLFLMISHMIRFIGEKSTNNFQQKHLKNYLKK